MGGAEQSQYLSGVTRLALILAGRIHLHIRGILINVKTKLMVNTSANNKRIAKNTLILYVRMLFMMLISLYTSRVILNALGAEDFGIYNVVGGVVAMMSFFSSSMATATQRFLNYEMGRGHVENLQNIFSVSFISYCIIGIIVVLVAETAGLWFLQNKLVIPSERMFAAFWVYQFSIATFIVSLLSVPYSATIIAHEKMSAFAYISIIEAIGKLVIAYLISISFMDKLIFYAILMFLVSLMVRGVYTIYCKKHFPECKLQWIWKKDLFQQLFSFSGWMLVGTVCNIFNTQGVNMLINIYFGPVLNAARAVAMQVYNAVNSFAVNFMTATRPQIMKSYAQKDYSYTYKLVYSSSKLSFGLLFILSIPLLLDTDYILELWLKKVPDFADKFVQLALIDLLITSAFSPIATLSQASGKIRNYQLIISVGFVLIFVLSWIAYYCGFPVYYTFVISIIINFIGLFVRVWEMKCSQEFPMAVYLKKVVMPICITFFITMILTKIIQMGLSLSESLVDFIVNNSVYMCIGVLLLWVITFDKKEKELIMDFVIKKIKR